MRGSCQRVVASASARPLTRRLWTGAASSAALLLVLEAAHHRGPASSKRDAHLGAIDAACAFDANVAAASCRPACQKIVVAIHHNGLGNQLFQWAFGKLVALDAGAAFAARKMREDEGPVTGGPTYDQGAVSVFTYDRGMGKLLRDVCATAAGRPSRRRSATKRTRTRNVLPRFRGIAI